MRNEGKERRCKSCGKLLLDEKISFCRRCFLEGRDKVSQIGGIVGCLLITLSAVALKNNNSDGNNDVST